jgi:hypothetical protein
MKGRRGYSLLGLVLVLLAAVAFLPMIRRTFARHISPGLFASCSYGAPLVIPRVPAVACVFADEGRQRYSVDCALKRQVVSRERQRGKRLGARCARGDGTEKQF